MFENLAPKKVVYLPLEQGSYIFTVKTAKWGETDVKTWDNGKATPTGEKEPQLQLLCQVSNVDGTNRIPSYSSDPSKTGEIQIDPDHMVYIVQKDLGFNGKTGKPNLGRAVICSTLGLPFDIEAFPETINDPNTFIGKKFQGILDVNGDGTRNKLMSVKPTK